MKDISLVKDTTPIENLSDFELITLAKNKNNRAHEILINRYKDFIYKKSRTYFLVGADKDDIIQEGMIGLYKAIRDYNVDKKASFPAFAELCITRQIITAIKTANRQKHSPLNSYISFNKPVYDDDSEKILLDVICHGTKFNPEDLVIAKESLSDIEEKIRKRLSKMEKQVLELHLKGDSYVEISKKLNKSPKSIDNALQRLKKKLSEDNNSPKE